MRKIGEAFDRCEREGRRAFIPFLVAGDPDLQTTLRALELMDQAGADIIELGIPFSDPIADGPIIQASYQRALSKGITLESTLAALQNVTLQAPLLLFTYLNPILQLAVHLTAENQHSTAATGTLQGADRSAERAIESESSDFDLRLQSGLDQLARRANEAGVSGVLISDLTPEEADFYQPVFRSHGMDTVFLAAPTTTEARLQKILHYCSGFLYLVARTGVTGKQTVLSSDTVRQIETIRRHSSLPIAIGFGIRTPNDVRRASAMADGVVVGSAVVENLHVLANGPGWDKAFKEYIFAFVEATNKSQQLGASWT